jgi:hypothetical protein
MESSLIYMYTRVYVSHSSAASGVPRNFFQGGGGLSPEFFRGVQQIQLRAEGRENGDLGAVAP